MATAASGGMNRGTRKPAARGRRRCSCQSARLTIAKTSSVIVLVTAWYGWRGVATVLGVYLAAVIVSTVYFGWHYVTDDLAGIAIAVVAVGLALLMVTGRLRPDRGDVVAAAQTEKVGAP